MSKPGPKTTFADLDRGTLDDGVAKLQRVLRDIRAFDVKSIRERRDDRLETWQKRVNNLLADMLGMASPDYAKHKLKPIDGDLDTTFGDHYSMEEYREAVQDGVAKALARIEETIAAMKGSAAGGGTAKSAPAPAATAAPTKAPAAAPTPAPTSAPTSAPTLAPTPAPSAAATEAPLRAPVAAPAATPAPAPAPKPPPPAPAASAAPTPMKSPASASTPASNRVLILGDSDAGASAAELLAQLGMEISVIDSPSVDRLDAARDAGFAVVVDAKGGDATMLAIGFLLAIVGKQKIALLGGQAPDALSGCVQVPLDDDGLWKLLLAREMKKAGLDVDLNRAL